ncbi:MAG: hypothetical protein K0Q72_3254 [Armatimonadetes bacterium]|nr:hypothetical protein [Armatimonadota bacterium]
MYRKWISDNPALQREWSLLQRASEGGAGSRGAGTWTVLGLLAAAYIGAGWWLSGETVTPWQGRAFLLVSALLYLLVVGLVLPARAVALLVRERREERWQELLLTTLEPGQIAMAKLLAAAFPAVSMLAAALPLLVMGAHAGRLPPDRFLLLLLVLVCTGPPVAAFGLWLAVRLRNPRPAMAIAYLLVNGCLWGTLAWYPPFYLRGENLWWYLSPGWQAALLCLASSNASPLALPLVPEWVWSILASVAMTALFLVLLTRRIARVEAVGGG